MEIEVTVTMADLATVEAEVAEMVEETKRKVASGELVPEPDEPEVEPCDCVGCSPHLGPEIPCTGKQSDGTDES